jgi:ribosomal protein S18 acetylase RimI-like enzyme
MSLSFANDSEARELSKMANAIWHEFFPGIIGVKQTEYMLMKFQTERAISEQMSEGYQYGFIYDGMEKAGYFSVRMKDGVLFISKLYLAKEFRHRGLGSAALAEILNMGKISECSYAYLTVNVNNVSACKTYEKIGMIKETEVNNDIGNGFFMNDYIYRYNY